MRVNTYVCDWCHTSTDEFAPVGWMHVRLEHANVSRGTYTEEADLCSEECADKWLGGVERIFREKRI